MSQIEPFDEGAEILHPVRTALFGAVYLHTNTSKLGDNSMNTAETGLRQNDNILPDIKLRQTAELTPYAGNARTHSNKQVKQIALSIERFGFTNPVLISDEGQIIAGHGRVAAAQLLGIDMVPTLRLSHLSEAERRAYVLADNKLAENAGWDHEILAIELQALIDLDFDLALIIGGAETHIDTTLVANIAKGHDWFERIKAGETYAEIARAGGISKRHVQRMLDLAFLAPDIVCDVCIGQHPASFTTEWLKKHPLPSDWSAQRAILKAL